VWSEEGGEEKEWQVSGPAANNQSCRYERRLSTRRVHSSWREERRRSQAETQPVGPRRTISGEAKGASPALALRAAPRMWRVCQALAGQRGAAPGVSGLMLG
jgi:hypothetical protein